MSPTVTELGAPVDVVAVVDEGLGNSSYVVDLGDGRALVIDPARHPGPYLAEADQRGLTVGFAVETHLHADFVSGARELGALGASVLAPGAGLHRHAVQPLVDGEELDLGGLGLRALATPGHTPEHLAYLLVDDGRPVALFSGGSLMVDSVARTDLIDPERTEALARQLWRSLHDRILGLPDDLVVYPTHGAGSFCSAPTGGERTTTIGREKRANPLLAADDEDDFVNRLLAGYGSYPPYFLRLRDLNRVGPHLYGPGDPVVPVLHPDDVARLHAAGAWLIDARPIAAYAAGHVPGSVSIAHRPQFGTWLGWIVPEAAPIVFVVDEDQDLADLVRQARNVGYEQLLGVLAGGVDAWRASGRHLDRTPLVPVPQASSAVIDVRQRSEYETGHLPGAHSVELGSITDTELPAGRLELMCGHGERAMTAASLLAARGRTDLTVLTGGPDDWHRSHGEPLEQPR